MIRTLRLTEKHSYL